MVAVQRANSPERPLMRRSASLALACVLSAWAMAAFLSSVACTPRINGHQLLSRATADPFQVAGGICDGGHVLPWPACDSTLILRLASYSDLSVQAHGRLLVIV